MDQSSLLALPPELLVNILSYLPIKSLLKFSQTSHASHALATSSLHTLSLAVYTTRIGGIMSRLGATSLPTPKQTSSVFASAQYSPSTFFLDTSSRSGRSSQTSTFTRAGDSTTHADPHAVYVLIPDSHTFPPGTLLAFHTALVPSILTRHKATLRHLDLSLWTLTPAVAHVLKSLPALRTLSLRIEGPHVRFNSRRMQATHRMEERMAWEILAENPSWAVALQALRIDGAQISTVQLSTILSANHLCRELWICKCSTVDREIWKWLGEEWKGREILKILGVLKCDIEIGEKDVDFISGMKALQFLSLQGCISPDNVLFEEKNEEVWHIPELIPTQLAPSASSSPTFIEVDPAYQTTIEVE